MNDAGQVSCSFAPQPSDVELELIEFIEMPLADSKSPARWNDMEHTEGRLFVSSEHDGKIMKSQIDKQHSGSMWPPQFKTQRGAR